MKNLNVSEDERFITTDQDTYVFCKSISENSDCQLCSFRNGEVICEFPRSSNTFNYCTSFERMDREDGYWKKIDKQKQKLKISSEFEKEIASELLG